jgi:hypothetical protein
MVTITLPPELEQIVAEQAAQQGITPERFALDKLRGLLLASSPPTEGQGTMADFFADFIGSIDSSPTAPGGSDLSENAGHKFKELMRQKYQEGKL